MIFKVGDKVKWNTGFYGGEQGSRYRDTWWAEVKPAKVVRIAKTKYLLELKDGSREWADAHDVVAA